MFFWFIDFSVIPADCGEKVAPESFFRCFLTKRLDHLSSTRSTPHSRTGTSCLSPIAKVKEALQVIWGNLPQRQIDKAVRDFSNKATRGWCCSLELAVNT